MEYCRFILDFGNGFIYMKSGMEKGDVILSQDNLNCFFNWFILFEVFIEQFIIFFLFKIFFLRFFRLKIYRCV